MTTPPPPPPGDPNQPPYGGTPPPPGQPPYGGAPPPSGGQPPYDAGQGGYGGPPGGYGSYPPGPGGGSGGQGTNGLAITSLVVSILGLLGNCFCFGGILSPVGAVLGWMGMKKADSSGGQVGGRGMGLAGLIIGVIGTLIFLAWVVFFIVAISTGEEFNYQFDTETS